MSITRNSNILTIGQIWWVYWPGVQESYFIPIFSTFCLKELISYRSNVPSFSTLWFAKFTWTRFHTVKQTKKNHETLNDYTEVTEKPEDFSGYWQRGKRSLKRGSKSIDCGRIWWGLHLEFDVWIKPCGWEIIWTNAYAPAEEDKEH